MLEALESASVDVMETLELQVVGSRGLFMLIKIIFLNLQISMLRYTKSHVINSYLVREADVVFIKIKRPSTFMSSENGALM